MTDTRHPCNRRLVTRPLVGDAPAQADRSFLGCGRGTAGKASPASRGVSRAIPYRETGQGTRFTLTAMMTHVPIPRPSNIGSLHLLGTEVDNERRVPQIASAEDT